MTDSVPMKCEQTKLPQHASPFHIIMVEYKEGMSNAARSN